MSLPLLSIIIPTRNEEKFIAETLKHVLSQGIGNKNYEIIISDGRSDDKTVSVAKKYRAKTLVADTHNAAEGRNYGAKYARGDILVFLDADTIMQKGLLKKIIESFNDGYVGGTVLISGIDSNIIDKILILFANTTARILSGLGVSVGHGPCIFIKKSVFNRIKGFNTKLDVNEDEELMQRASKFGKTILLNDKVKISLRRIRKQGWIKILWIWISTFFQMLLFKRISNKEYWEDR